MSNSSPSNSIWPSNGIIGSEQIQIPDGINTKWPEGDALVGNFVYKEGKLAGFVDCNSLVINDSKTTVIPYDYAELELPSILKDTMTITSGERCKNLIVNCLEDAAVYTAPLLNEILGIGNHSAEFIKKENRLLVHADRIDNDKLQEVTQLLENNLPSSIVVDVQRDYDYVYLDYVGGGNFNNFLVNEPYVFNEDVNDRCGVYVRATQRNTGSSTGVWGLNLNAWSEYGNPYIGDGYTKGPTVGNYSCGGATLPDGKGRCFELYRNWLGDSKYRVTSSTDSKEMDNIFDNWYYGKYNSNKQAILGFYSINKDVVSGYAGYYIHEAKFCHNNVITRHFLPVLDELGNPALYDRIKKETYTNNSTGNMEYGYKYGIAPSSGNQTNYALERPVNYGQLTENGIRRIYKVPTGSNMTKREYAEENGFKEIVDTPMPETGYWTSKWVETDSQIICEWIEIDSPEQKIES